jgi:hypothetical protein
MFNIRPPTSGERRLLLIGRLQDAEAEHDATIRSMRGGVCAPALSEDVRRWRAVGSAMAELARTVRRECAASAFCDARPCLELLAARLVEAIDDQIDAPAWRVINAQARLEAARSA